jgi:hypothetical protein
MSEKYQPPSCAANFDVYHRAHQDKGLQSAALK